MSKRQPWKHALDDSLAASLTRLYQEEVKAHGSLLDVIEIDTSDPAWGLPPQALIEHFGYGDFQVYNFDPVSDDGYSEAAGIDGGHMNIVQDPGGGYRTIVFIKSRESSTANGSSDLSREGSAGIRIASFLHELGHVNDFERRLNLVVGQPFDLAMAEEYAHHFACRKMMRHHLRFPLAFYLAVPISQFLSHEVGSIRRAATRFHDSPVFNQYARFAGDLYYQWGEG